MAEILLVRHGETDWNRLKRLQGHLDIGLNDLGRKQAQLLGKALASEKIEVAYSSDLSRAVDTTQEIIQHHDVPTFIDQSIRERCYGEIQGMTFGEIEKSMPDNHRAWHSRQVDFQPKGGESLREFFNRVVVGVSRIALTHLGKRILIVAHGGVLDCLYRAASSLSIEDPHRVEMKNTSLNLLNFDGEKFSIIKWGDLSHLQDINALDEIDNSYQSKKS